MNSIRCKGVLLNSVLAMFFATVTGCGGGGDCSLITIGPDPSGFWTGVLERHESDCGQLSKGARFNFQHEVSAECEGNRDSVVYLVNEDNRQFNETDFSNIGGGSFTVQNSDAQVTIDISYENFDGSLADVVQKIRVYNNGKIVCSERYKGQARKR